MSKKYEAYFFEYKSFHTNEVPPFWVAEYNRDSDARCLYHSPTGGKEIREITKEEYDKLSDKQKLRVMVRTKKAEAPKVDADVNNDGVVDEKDVKAVEKAAKKAKKKTRKKSTKKKASKKESKE